MPRLPSLNAMRAFEATARLGGVARAARELHVTHGAVSRQIRALEISLGVRLFRPERGKLVLTAHGAEYHADLKDAFRRVTEATDRIVATGGRVKLRINVLPTFANRWLLPRLSSFCTTHPGIIVEISSSSDAVYFDPGEWDASIRSLTPEAVAELTRQRSWRGLALNALLSEALFPVCHPGRLSGPNALRHPRDLRGHTLLQTRSVLYAWSEWLAAAGETGWQPKNEIWFDHFWLALQAAEQGDGVALGSWAFVADQVRRGRLATPFIRPTVRDTTYYLIYRERTERPREIAAFRAWLVDQTTKTQAVIASLAKS